jgi:oxygen-independent coproporphyrinogen-3 oxidase
MIPEYIQAVNTEIEFLGRASPERLTIHTVYFGGGTPSLIPANDMERILTTIHERFEVISPAEISIEVNPGTVWSI